MKLKARVTSNLVSRWVPATVDDIDVGVLAMVTDIHRRSAILAPVDTRALVNSGRIERMGKAAYRVIYGGGRVRYARRRHYENKLHPGTLGYLERAGDSVVRSGIRKYL